MKLFVTHYASVIVIKARIGTYGTTRLTVEINGKPFAEGETSNRGLKAWVESHVLSAKARIDSDRAEALPASDVLYELGFRDK
ncbi:hypothetical protein [Larkinella sp. C7]|uniref:hypothetical protein n=1 Tax=Larkinella sp. C7 TaxID=2576607 RepID=UPI001111578F|nr:hypothetical protein [Larkinella sp. C7]